MTVLTTMVMASLIAMISTVMMTLSATLASLGLLQGSTAVVIGAMLVAPLMGPLVAAGLALVQGNAQGHDPFERAFAHVEDEFVTVAQFNQEAGRRLFQAWLRHEVIWNGIGWGKTK